jgi:YebC/PmpR family DNA-binding regulatory protein
MAGHNKWSKVKRLKGALDAKRGKIFSKLAKEIAIAARQGGGDPATNPRLRSAILNARAQNMPGDNIDRAVKRGTGEAGTGSIEEIVYEGYGPGGIAIIMEAATDNRNRTAQDLRSTLSKYGGNLGSSGSVTYLFKHRGQIAIPAAGCDADRLLEVLIEAGGEELTEEEDSFNLLTAPDQLYRVAEAIRAAGFQPETQKLVYLPETTLVVADQKQAAQVLRLFDALEENDDVQNVFSNFDVPNELIAALSV